MQVLLSEVGTDSAQRKALSELGRKCSGGVFPEQQRPSSDMDCIARKTIDTEVLFTFEVLLTRGIGKSHGNKKCDHVAPRSHFGKRLSTRMFLLSTARPPKTDKSRMFCSAEVETKDWTVKH